MKPLVSIIVPVYKVEKYLDRCVESLVNQTYKNIEIILVDDGSPDNCPEMCDAWAHKDSRIVVIHKENGGVSSARNKGLESARGEWIWFVDSDDYVELFALEKLVPMTDNSDLIIFDTKIDELYVKDDRFFDNYYFMYRFGFGPCNKLYKKSIITENNLKFDVEEAIGEDLLFNIYYYRYAESYCFSSLNLYHYVLNENSAMHTNTEKRIEQQLSLYSKIYKLYSDIDDRIMKQLFIMHLISGINQYGKKNIDSKKLQLISDASKKYLFDKPSYKEAINCFLKSEGAGFLGAIRIKLFFTILRISPKIAVNIL